MTTKSARIVIMGPPGSGKSTQAEILANRLGVPYISTGDLLRHIASEDIPLGEEIKKYLDQGAIVPDELTVQLIVAIVSKEEYHCGYVGEGFPRTLIQAEAMNNLIDQVIYIEISDALVADRLLSRLICPKCGNTYNILTKLPKIIGVCDECQSKLVNRSDDNKEVIANRLAVYHQTTEPVIAFFKSKNKLLVVNGEPPIATIAQNILKVIARHVSNEVEFDSTK